MAGIKEVTINGTNYMIECHPGEEGLIMGFELNRLVGASVYKSQQAVSSAFDTLTDEDRAELEKLSKDEQEQAIQNILIDRIDTSEMLEAAISLLEGLKAKEMATLCKDMFKYVMVSGAPLDINDHFRGRYADVIPLFGEVAAHNGFFDLDATEMLKVR